MPDSIYLAIELVRLIQQTIPHGKFKRIHPLEYIQSNSLLVNFLISGVVAIAGAVASIDTAGRRELIGLAAVAQFAGYPVWLGIRLVLGLPSAEMMSQRLLIFLVNLMTLVVVSFITYRLVSYRPEVFKRYTAWFKSN